MERRRSHMAKNTMGKKQPRHTNILPNRQRKGETMSEWKITDNRVHGNGQSYPCNNRITAEQLHQTLTTYEKTYQQHKQTEAKLDKITKTIIQLQMSLTILQDDLDKIKKELNI